MSAATTAALIGAGVGSAASLMTQLLAHVLSVSRDRRNQRRAQLYEAIVDAALALYAPHAPVKPDPDRPPPKPGTIGATIRISPELEHLQQRVAESITLLQVYFGHDHPLIRSYTEAATVCLKARDMWDDHLEDESEEARIARIPQVMDQMRDAQRTRDAWMREARAVVARI